LTDYEFLAHAQSRRGGFRHISAISKQPLSYIASDQKVEFEKAGHFRDGGSELRVAW
jgi:cold shock CspA family protein